MFAESPLNGRLRFKLRPLNNWLFCSVVFTGVAFVLAQSIPTPVVWLADAGATAVLFYVNFFVLDKRSIGMRCPHCDEPIATNMPWVCGFCGGKNQRTDEFPFVNQCEHCTAEPKAYKCHHARCGKLIFLTSDMLEINYAYCVNSPVSSPADAPNLDDQAIREKQRQEKQHEIAMAEFEEKLKQINERVQGPKVKTLYEQKKAKLNDYYSGVMGIRQDVRKLRAEAAELYKNDPESLQDANDTLDACLRMLS
jgi:hypothetical protein